ncbi:hypothetical protein [Phormidium nigroviride]
MFLQGAIAIAVLRRQKAEGDGGDRGEGEELNELKIKNAKLK